MQRAHELNGVASDPIHNDVIRVDDHFARRSALERASGGPATDSFDALTPVGELGRTGYSAEERSGGAQRYCKSRNASAGSDPSPIQSRPVMLASVASKIPPTSACVSVKHYDHGALA